ncbi:DsrH/TusB family sulfur relay protein [Histophilus somni]|uniref:DsrH/TusB family sulfur relay protein n=1 Tax=Histophilus somni TaxID=731 RepID=UPI00201F9C11|nr:DsrH/TusB family sulfur relay protein [Histophilus somni]
MLYTFSQSSYDINELTGYLDQITPQDVLVLWQDAVLLPLKHPQIFACLNIPIMFLQPDVEARNLSEKIFVQLPQMKIISLDELVELTVTFTPQLAL